MNATLCSLTLLHSERPKLYTILAFLSAIGLMVLAPALTCYIQFMKWEDLKYFSIHALKFLNNPCSKIKTFQIILTLFEIDHIRYDADSTRNSEFTTNTRFSKYGIYL